MCTSIPSQKYDPTNGKLNRFIAEKDNAALGPMNYVLRLRLFLLEAPQCETVVLNLSWNTRLHRIGWLSHDNVTNLEKSGFPVESSSQARDSYAIDWCMQCIYCVCLLSLQNNIYGTS